MGGEPNQGMWRGIRPTDPAENIPVDIKVFSVDIPIKNSWVLQDSGYVYVQNPAGSGNQITTGPLAAGHYDITLSVTTDVDHRYFALQHRQPDPTITLHEFRFFTRAYIPHQLYIKNWYFGAGEWIRLLNAIAMTGWLTGTLWWTQRS